MELFCRNFANQKSSICGNCQSSGHTTNWCPNLEHSFPTGTARQMFSGYTTGPLGQVDELDRPIHYLGKVQLCNIFNYMACLCRGVDKG